MASVNKSLGLITHLLAALKAEALPELVIQVPTTAEQGAGNIEDESRYFRRLVKKGG